MSSEHGTRLPWLAGGLGALTLLLALVWWPGCRQYPAVTSREALSLVKLMYAACNTRDPARLAAAESDLGKLRQSGKLTSAEGDAFDGIVRKARAGAWDAGAADALRFAQDQVGVGHPDPESHQPPKPEARPR